MTVYRKSDSGVLSKVILVSVLFISMKFASCHQRDTVACILRNGQRGQCIKFEECRTAYTLSRKGIKPEFCSFEGRIVCCIDDLKETESTSQNERKPSQRRPVERRPSPERQPSYSQKRKNEVPDPKNSDSYFEGSYEADLNPGREKQNPGSRRNQGRKKNIQSNYDVDESETFEKRPNNLHPESDISRRPSGGSVGQSKDSESDFYDVGSFVPPNLIKKNQYGVEKTTENEYYNEYDTKKPNRGQNRKSFSKQNDNNNSDGSHQPKRVVEVTTRRSNGYNQGGKVTSNSNDWYEEENEYQNGYYNPESTTKRNKVTTSKPSDYFGNRPSISQNGNSYQETDEYFNRRPTKRPYKTSTETNYQSRPTSQQGSRPQENNRPNTRPHRRLRISERKCQEYSKEITKNITGLPLTTNPDPVTIPVRKCITAQQLIVGGENTTVGEFPHMAAIGFSDKQKRVSWKCGGSLISERFVMTAGHCGESSFGRPVKVRLGEYDLKKNDDGAHPVDYGVIEVIIHPEYRSSSKYNDIALIKLSRVVTFFKHIRPACLYSKETLSETKAIATGWGRLSYDGESSDVLQKVVLSIVDNNTCNRLYKISAVVSRGITETQMCAGELAGGKDTCQGDSGGPLSITSTKCIHHIIGITSFGKACALPNATGVYTRVSSFVPWIESIVWPEN